jgi:hypothetical protein
LIDALEFDPAADVVTISIDDWEERLSDNEGWSAKGATKFQYRAKNEDGASILLNMDFDVKTGSFRLKTLNFKQGGNNE